LTAVLEPILDGAEIQGNVLAGFRKDFQSFLFLSVPDAALVHFRQWLRQMSSRVSYTDSVLSFNIAFRTLRAQLRNEPPLSAAWLNIAFTGSGVRRLLPGAVSATFDPTFLNGPVMDAQYVGEPPVGDPFGPQSWVIGAPGKDVDALVITAADDQSQLQSMNRMVVDSLGAADKSIRIVREDGAVRTAEPGHEHFGFKDCISQPGIRGTLRSTGQVVTRRVLDSTDPAAALYAAPGVPLCWPGEFVLGYPRKRTGSIDPSDIVIDQVDPSQVNGSYLVYRRLAQDVAAFDAFVGATVASLSRKPGFRKMTTELLGALLVGRWKSGAPVMRAPTQDLRELGADRYAANNFQFASNGRAPIYASSANLLPDTFPLSQADSGGNVCPYAAHIRKVNTRDQTTDQGTSVRTLEHRILRRGIPFGDDYDPNDPTSASKPRGLQFLCYQASIGRGFQFLMHQWANSDNFPLQDQRGEDPLIGQKGGAARTITLLGSDGSRETVTLPSAFIRTTGAVYAFTPSRTSLETIFAGPIGRHRPKTHISL
jgi:Dyp-type peroxidase family